MKRIILLFALAAALPTSAFARGGELSTITLGFRDGTPSEIRTKVHNFLNQNYTFVKGTFLNTFISQRFAGSPGKLNDLIQLLHASQFELKVEFADLKDDGATFLLSQNMTAPGEATITINVTKGEFRWSELKFQIPRGRGDVEPGGPANGSQPVRSGTNSASSATGSRR